MYLGTTNFVTASRRPYVLKSVLLYRPWMYMLTEKDILETPIFETPFTLGTTNFVSTFVNCRRCAEEPPDDHHAVGSSADLLSALRGGTCHARALHAIRAGP